MRYQILLIFILSFGLSGTAEAKFLKKMTIDGQKLGISFKATKSSAGVKKAGMIPRGSALITGSGKLKDKGITHIIHAATGSMTNSSTEFKPSLKGIKHSILNALLLASEFGHKSIAIPFLGGGIFLSSLGLTKGELAEEIISVAVNNNLKKLKVVFVTWSQEDTKVFEKAYKKIVKDNTSYRLVKGSITDHDLHGASVIVNAANMEVMFGGGLSGVIGRATKESGKIDDSAKKFIHTFNKL